MSKTFKIEEDCANCANLVEEAVKKVEGVKDLLISFMTQKMKVAFRLNDFLSSWRKENLALHTSLIIYHMRCMCPMT